MAEPFIGEITLFGFSFPPRGWALCNGGVVAISQNQALYALIGAQFGGDGRSTFAYPDFRGRTPLHRDTQSSVYRNGFKGGSESVTLSSTEIANHTHEFLASSDTADKNAPSEGRSLAVATQPVYSHNTSSVTTMSPLTSSFTGGGQSHANVQPSQVINFCIALTGIFPQRS